jgi:diguanylate cyclase (GGDEF)-like protein
MEAAALRLLAAQSVHSSAPEEAARAAERACKLYEELGEETGLCESLIELALNYIWLGLHDEALDAVTRSLSLAVILEDQRLMFWAYNRTGVVHNTLGDPLQANEFLVAALALAAPLGDDENFCILNNLADNAPDAVEKLRESGRFEEADAFVDRSIGYARAALARAADGKHNYREALVRGNLGLLLAIAGDFEEAAAHLGRSLALAEAHGFANLALATAHYMARADLLRGDLAQGIPRLRHVLERATANGEKPIIAEVNLQLSEAYQKSGDASLALAHYRAFHEAEKSFNTMVAQTRSRMLSNMFELEASKIEAERARLEADALRSRSAGLEAEKLALQVKADELNRHAHQDALTGLWNRRHIESRLPALFGRQRPGRPPLCIALGDLDAFKSINDRFGHPVGDQVLVRTARILLGCARQSDIVARFGGEEFLIAFVDIDAAAATAAAERMRAGIEGYDWGQVCPGLRVTISIGLTSGAGADFPGAIQAADTLLYKAKNGGRNRVETG